MGKEGQGNFAGIVDYKSGNKAIVLTEVYEGLAMQMMTYLNVLQQNTDQLGLTNSQLAGALYMHIQNPTLKLTEMKDDLETEMMRANRYDGLLVDNTNLLDQLDTSMLDNPSAASLVYPISTKKDGSYSSRSKLISMEHLELLLARNKERIMNAANGIFDGSVNLNPVRWSKQQTALQYSPYLDIFEFDAMLPDNQYHDIITMKDDDLFKKLKEADD